MRRSEEAGTVAGGLLAPLTAAGALARRDRLFHPRGVTYSARVEPLVHLGGRGLAARRLKGPAIVRLSGAWWRFAELPDVLGFAIRFRRNPEPSPLPEDGDQDLLFATIRSPWTMLLAPTTTHQHDFLANDYYAVSPFEVDDLGRVKWRLVAERGAYGSGSREEKLARAVEQGRAVFSLQARVGARKEYECLAQVTLEQQVDLDPDALTFSPFRDGRGIRPIGFVHALRHATYALAQGARHRVMR